MKKCMLLVLIFILTIGTFGCSGNVEKKEVPNEFADAKSVLTYLEKQNEIYMQTEKMLVTFQKTNVRIQQKMVSSLMLL